MLRPVEFVRFFIEKKCTEFVSSAIPLTIPFAVCAVMAAAAVAPRSIAFAAEGPESAEKYNPYFCPRPVGAMSLDTDIKGYSFNNAYWMAWAAWIAYDMSGNGALSKLEKVGLANARVVSIPKSGLQAYVASTDDFVVVAFRGTDGPLDVLFDLSFDQKHDDTFGVEGKVHEGFLAAINSGWPELRAEIMARTAANQGKPVYVTGHSLGAAMASLAAIRLKLDGFNISGVYLNSTPRTGDATFAKFYDAHLRDVTYRVVIDEDIIPRLPPPAEAASEFGKLIPGPLGNWATKIFGDFQYTHVGWQLHIDKEGVMRGPFNFNDSQDKDYWARVFERSKGKPLWNMVMKNSRLVINHIPVANFCYLANARKSNHQASQVLPEASN